MTDQVATDIKERLAFLGIGAAEKALISRIGHQVRQTLRPALDRFYRRIDETPALSRLFLIRATRSPLGPNRKSTGAAFSMATSVLTTFRVPRLLGIPMPGLVWSLSGTLEVMDYCWKGLFQSFFRKLGRSRRKGFWDAFFESPTLRCPLKRSHAERVFSSRQRFWIWSWAFRPIR